MKDSDLDVEPVVLADEGEAESLLATLERRLQEEDKILARGYEMGEEHTIQTLRNRIEASLSLLQGPKKGKPRKRRTHKDGLIEALHSVLNELDSFKFSPPTKRTVFYEKVDTNANSRQSN